MKTLFRLRFGSNAIWRRVGIRCTATSSFPIRSWAWPHFRRRRYTQAHALHAARWRAVSALRLAYQRHSNNSKTWYNSLQVEFQSRAESGYESAGGLHAVEDDGAGGLDGRTAADSATKSVPARYPHRISIANVWELPFGRGRRFFNTSHGLWSRLISGWENSVIFQYQSGWPASLPANAMYVKDATLPNIDWSAPVVKGHETCAARWNDNGTITMVPASVAAGCTDYNWLVMPRFGPARYTPLRDGRIRMHTAPSADVSLNKMTMINERFRLQFRAEAFNITNTYVHNRQGFNTNPESSSFGTLTRATVSSTNSNLPRNIQLGIKLIW